MGAKEIKITPPDGYEVDKENSTFDCIKFKKKYAVSYEDVEKELFEEKVSYYITSFGTVDSICVSTTKNNFNHCVSFKQANKLLAINKLMNVAKYLNGNWKPDWNDSEEYKFYICINNMYRKEDLDISINTTYRLAFVYFKTEEFAKQAIKILGEETIRFALSADV